MSSLFESFYDNLMSPLEKWGFQKVRKDLIHKAKGNVLEIGSGTGLNFPYYQFDQSVVAIEPSSSMREKSMKRVKESQACIDVREGTAEQLPFPSDYFDTVVVTLVLCSVSDLDQALEEIHRVCKPNGLILLFEHIRVRNPVMGRLQDWLTPVSRRLCDGCHLNRDTLRRLRSKGIKVMRFKRWMKGIFIVIEATKK